MEWGEKDSLEDGGERESAFLKLLHEEQMNGRGIVEHK